MSKERKIQYPLKQTVRTHQHINSAMLQTARCLKTELQRNTTNRGEHSRGNKRKMARKEEAQIIAM
jgi:hypothetical protein